MSRQTDRNGVQKETVMQEGAESSSSHAGRQERSQSGRGKAGREGIKQPVGTEPNRQAGIESHMKYAGKMGRGQVASRQADRQ